jgi:hypothetical protein
MIADTSPSSAAHRRVRAGCGEAQVNTGGRVLGRGSCISARERRWTFSFRVRILAL